jgi:hypothetical protein
MYSSGWGTYYNTGPYNNTLHNTTTYGATASLVFQGPAQFVLTYTGHSNRGLIEIWVDGNLVTVLNADTPDLIWQMSYTSPVFSDGITHTLLIKNSNVNGEFIDIDAVQIITP